MTPFAEPGICRTSTRPAISSQRSSRACMASAPASSQSSVGILQATQAGNQLVGVQTRQPADLTALLAAQNRSQALEQAHFSAH